MAGSPDTLPRRIRAWFRTRKLLSEGRKRRQVMSAAVLMPTLALFAALGVLLNDSYFERDLGASVPSPIPSAATASAYAATAPSTAATAVAPTPSATRPPVMTETPISTEALSVSMPEEARVFIPQSGARYHKTAACSGMVDPMEVTLQEAKDRGFTPCKRCNPPE